jgi:hypothetical protein
MNGDGPKIGNWHQSQTCVDYIVYAYALPTIDMSRWQAMVKQMRMLGICQDTTFGVTTVRGPWGFFQIPAHKFPDLKATFFKTSELVERRRLLAAISEILENVR